jgi:hypothetical protein
VRQRSDKTEIRGLRMTLRNARAALRHVLDRAPLDELDRGLCRTVVSHINNRLAPKLRRGAPSRQRRGR